jgi:hypothetical protein
VYEAAIAAMTAGSDSTFTFFYSELIVGTRRVRGGCKDWAVLISALTQALAGSKKVSNITMFATNELGVSVLENQVECDSHAQNMADISSGLTSSTVGSNTVTCNGHVWRSEKCSAVAGGVNTCVDCINACSTTIEGNNE